jgi:hypothetical protein
MERMKLWIGVCAMLVSQAYNTFAQKVDDERMKRDIEVSENVLSTLVKQELNQQRGLWGMDIKGAYLPGYGVTFRLPIDYNVPFVFSIGGEDNASVVYDRRGDSYSYSITTRDGRDEEDDDSEDRAVSLKDKARLKKQLNADSVRGIYHEKLIKASKDFIIDYGDFLSQLGPNERIVVTNKGDHSHGWYFKTGKRTHISVEGLKSDITAFKQGKITREQALDKLKVINTESVETKEPDMELLSSILNRLYRADLSNTYFTDNNIYYERLKDYGVIYYMEVFSSTEASFDRVNMPTQDLQNIDKATRDKKVTELYPKFEQELKENVLEYGRTLKSLKPEEMLMVNVMLTKCKSCGIPSTVEVSVKASVLKDFDAGKLDKNAALSKFSVKKGVPQ